MLFVLIRIASSTYLINRKKKITGNHPKYNNVKAMGYFCWGLENKFEIAMVKEPSVFAPQKFY